MPIYFQFLWSRRTLCTATTRKIYARHTCIFLTKRIPPKFAAPFFSEKANDSPCRARYHIYVCYNIQNINYHFPHHLLELMYAKQAYPSWHPPRPLSFSSTSQKSHQIPFIFCHNLFMFFSSALNTSTFIFQWIGRSYTLK